MTEIILCIAAELKPRRRRSPEIVQNHGHNSIHGIPSISIMFFFTGYFTTNFRSFQWIGRKIPSFPKEFMNHSYFLFCQMKTAPPDGGALDQSLRSASMGFKLAA